MKLKSVLADLGTAMLADLFAVVFHKILATAAENAKRQILGKNDAAIIYENFKGISSILRTIPVDFMHTSRAVAALYTLFFSYVL